MRLDQTTPFWVSENVLNSQIINYSRKFYVSLLIFEGFLA